MSSKYVREFELASFRFHKLTREPLPLRYIGCYLQFSKMLPFFFQTYLGFCTFRTPRTRLFLAVVVTTPTCEPFLSTSSSTVGNTHQHRLSKSSAIQDDPLVGNLH